MRPEAEGRLSQAAARVAEDMMPSEAGRSHKDQVLCFHVYEMPECVGGGGWGHEVGVPGRVRSVAHDMRPGNTTVYLHVAEGTLHRMCFLEINRLNRACEDAFQVPSARRAGRGKRVVRIRLGEGRGLRVEKAERDPLPPPLARGPQQGGLDTASRITSVCECGLLTPAVISSMWVKVCI